MDVTAYCCGLIEPIAGCTMDVKFCRTCAIPIGIGLEPSANARNCSAIAISLGISGFILSLISIRLFWTPSIFFLSINNPEPDRREVIAFSRVINASFESESKFMFISFIISRNFRICWCNSVPLGINGNCISRCVLAYAPKESTRMTRFPQSPSLQCLTIVLSINFFYIYSGFTNWSK